MSESEKAHPWLQRDGYSEAEYSRLLRSLSPHKLEFHDLRARHQPDSFIITARPR